LTKYFKNKRASMG